MLSYNLFISIFWRIDLKIRSCLQAANSNRGLSSNIMRLFLNCFSSRISGFSIIKVYFGCLFSILIYFFFLFQVRSSELQIISREKTHCQLQMRCEIRVYRTSKIFKTCCPLAFFVSTFRKVPFLSFYKCRRYELVETTSFVKLSMTEFQFMREKNQSISLRTDKGSKSGAFNDD